MPWPPAILVWGLVKTTMLCLSFPFSFNLEYCKQGSTIFYTTHEPTTGLWPWSWPMKSQKSRKGCLCMVDLGKRRRGLHQRWRCIQASRPPCSFMWLYTV